MGAASRTRINLETSAHGIFLHSVMPAFRGVRDLRWRPLIHTGCPGVQLNDSRSCARPSRKSSPSMAPSPWPFTSRSFSPFSSASGLPSISAGGLVARPAKSAPSPPRTSRPSLRSLSVSPRRWLSRHYSRGCTTGHSADLRNRQQTRGTETNARDNYSFSVGSAYQNTAQKCAMLPPSTNRCQTA